MIRRGLSVRETEKLAARPSRHGAARPAAATSGASADIAALERQLGDMLGPQGGDRARGRGRHGHARLFDARPARHDLPAAERREDLDEGAGRLLDSAGGRPKAANAALSAADAACRQIANNSASAATMPEPPGAHDLPLGLEQPARSPWRADRRRQRASCCAIASFSFQNKDLPGDAMTAVDAAAALDLGRAAGPAGSAAAAAPGSAGCPRSLRLRSRSELGLEAAPGSPPPTRRPAGRSPSSLAGAERVDRLMVERFGRLGRGVEIERELLELAARSSPDCRRPPRRSAGRRPAAMAGRARGASSTRQPLRVARRRADSWRRPARRGVGERELEQLRGRLRSAPATITTGLPAAGASSSASTAATISSPAGSTRI